MIFSWRQPSVLCLTLTRSCHNRKKKSKETQSFNVSDVKCHLFWRLGWKHISSALNLSLYATKFPSHTQKMKTWRESAETFVHCTSPSFLVLLISSALYSWLNEFSSSVILGEWLQLSWMSIFWPLSLIFYYSISKKLRYLWCSSYLFHFFPLPHRKTSEGMHISAIFLFSSLASHFSFLVLFPHLRAEVPQCLLLTFSYHLSPFHHNHYPPCFLLAPCLSPPLSPSHTSFVSHSLISILLLSQGAG